jgi:secreted PhoX family phosphatase
MSDAGAPLKPVKTMGRFAHENTIGIPGFRRQVVLAGFDDSSGASELYLTVAANEDAVVNDKTSLYVFKSNVVQSGNMTPGQQITGEFVNIINPQDLSLSQMQARVNSLNAMKFVRLEDGDYIRGMDGSFFFVDTGSSSVAKCGTSGTQLCDPFGSIYRMDLDLNNPTKNARLTLIARSDGSTWKSPDNIGVSRNTLMMNEDPADSGISRTFGRPPAIWEFPILSGGNLGAPTKVAELDNPGCGFGGTCDESSGIVDMSDYTGPGTWLFDVQAHSLRNARGGEHGQLIFFQQFGS